MRLYVSLLFLICVLTSTHCDEQKLADIIISEIDNLALPFPTEYDHLLGNTKTSSEFIIISILHSEIESVLRLTYKLPAEVIAQFAGIAFSKELKIQSFSFVLAENTGHLDEYVCAAYNEKDVIRLAYVRVHSEAELIPQYVKLSQKQCDSYFIFWEKCNDVVQFSTKGYTVDEVKKIERVLRSSAYEQLKRKSKYLENDSQFILLQYQRYFSLSKEAFCVLKENGNIEIYYHGLTDINFISSIKVNGNKDNSPYTFHITMNGNMQILDKNKNIAWQSLSGNGNIPHTLMMQEDFNLVLFDKNRKPIWDSQNILKKYEFYLAEDTLLFSPNGKYFLIVQQDGNVILYSVAGKNGSQENIPIWSTNTYASKRFYHRLVLEGNGNLILYAANVSAILWQTNPPKSGSPPFSVELTDSGALLVLDSKKTPVWSSQK